MNTFSKSMAEWDALEKAERKTLRGKIKYAWEDYVYYPLYRIWYKVSEIPNEIKYFVQRGMRGYSDRDTWSIDYYLSSWMPRALRSIAKTGMSYPGVGEVNTPKKWAEIIKKMEKGFEASNKLGDWKYSNPEELKKLQQTQKDGLKLFCKYFDALWD